MKAAFNLVAAPFKAVKWVSDKAGWWMTAGGTFMLPFVGAAAHNAYLVNSAASNFDILTSFWTPLFTDPTTGAFNLAAGTAGFCKGLGLILQALYETAAPIVTPVLSAAYNSAAAVSPLLPIGVITVASLLSLYWVYTKVAPAAAAPAPAPAKA